MGVGESRTPWIEVSDGVGNGDHALPNCERTGPSGDATVQTRADWGLLVLTAVMSVPFALVAWLMS